MLDRNLPSTLADGPDHTRRLLLIGPAITFFVKLTTDNFQGQEDFALSILNENFNSSYVTIEVTSSETELLFSSNLKYYTYRNISGLSESKLATTLQWITASDDVTQVALLSEHTNYYETDDMRKGRKKEIIRATRDALDYSIKSTEPILSFEYTLGGPSNTELTTQSTETDQDGNKRIYSETRSVLSGRIIRQVDANGNRAEYGYNNYGKLSSHTTCAQSPTYTQTTHYSYPAPGQVKIVQPNGQTSINEYDGQDQLIREYLLTDEKRLIKQISYDAIGRQLRTVLYDYMADGKQTQEWSELQYDDWNEVSGEIFSDESQQFRLNDPIALTLSEWRGNLADKHRKVTTYNEDKTVKKIEWKDQAGSTIKTQTMTYNRSKLITQLKTTGEFGTATINYSYDAIGRLLKEQHIEKADGLLAPSTTYTYHYTYAKNWYNGEAVKIEIETAGVKRRLGERTFDTWGRITSQNRGNSNETYIYNSANPVPVSKTDPDGTLLKYEYINELGSRVSKISTTKPAEQQIFSYAFGAQNTSTTHDGQTFLEYNHDQNYRVIKERIKAPGGNIKEMLCNYSIGGRLLDETDASGNNTLFQYNKKGQRFSTTFTAEKLSTLHLYDKGRLSKETIDQLYASVRTMADVDYSYDTQQRETGRHFTINDVTNTRKVLDLNLENTYYADSRLKTVQLKKDQQIIGSRSVTYTPGGHLDTCSTTGVFRPNTPKNKPIDRQQFTYDALGNVTVCVTTFGNEKCTTTYTYDSTNGFRLEKVKNDHPDYVPSATLSYDQSGRVTQDPSGKKYTYDWLGRVIQAGSTRYTYDPADRLMTREQDNEQRQITYSGLQARGEYRTDSTEAIRRLSPGSRACTVQRVELAGVERLLYELRDNNGTVLASYDAQAQTLKYHAYSAFGEHSSDETQSMLGFNGEYRDASSDQYPLGRGYRWYDPSSKRFHVQDSLSPFDAGGINLYAYCVPGDPANYHDPDGHSSSINGQLRAIWGDSLPAPVSLGKNGDLLLNAIWAGVGVLTAVMSGGTSLLMASALIGLSVVSAGSIIASVIVTDKNWVEVLTWFSLFTGLAGGIATIGKKIFNLAQYFARTGPAVTRNLYGKAAAAIRNLHERVPAFMRPLGRKFGWFKDYDDMYGVTTTFNIQSLTGAPKATRLFDGGDINTVVCFVTGVLGNTNYFKPKENDEAKTLNNDIGNITGLPWGSLGSLWTSGARH